MENNVQNEKQDKPQNGGNGNKIMIFVVLLILVLAIGLCGGYLLSINRNKQITTSENEKKTEQKSETEVRNDEKNKNGENSENNNILNENNNNSKIDNILNENNSNSLNNTSQNQTSTNNKQTNTSKVKYEKDSFYFYAPESWNCKIQEVDNKQYKLNSDDKYYEITGNVNGKEEIAFSIMITSDTSYDESSWVNIGQYNGEKYIYNMQRFVCRDNDGINHNDSDYKFEKEVADVMETLTVKYKVTNEFGSANATKVLEGKFFIRGEAGTSAKSYIYYIKDGNVCRTSLTDGFSTDILANYAKSMNISNDGKIHVYPQGNSFMNNIAQEDDYVVYEKIN